MIFDILKMFIGIIFYFICKCVYDALPRRKRHKPKHQEALVEAKREKEEKKKITDELLGILEYNGESK